MQNLDIIVLCAGKGTRMKVNSHKVLLPVGGLPIILHVLLTALSLQPKRLFFIVGHQKESVVGVIKAFCGDSSEGLTSFNYKGVDIHFTYQAEQLGSAHAVKLALEHRVSLSQALGKVLVLYGDSPLVPVEALTAMLNHSGDLAYMGFDNPQPYGYGRMLTQGGALVGIVEEKDATDSQKLITLCNAGICKGDFHALLGWVRQVKSHNKSQEYYLTDCASIAHQSGVQVGLVIPKVHKRLLLGANTMEELSEIESIFQDSRRQYWLQQGVQMLSPSTVYTSYDTVIGKEVVIEPNVYLGASVVIEEGVRIKAFSYLEGCVVRSSASIGPFARIRPTTEVGKGAKVGNFVELKQVTLGEKSKVNHLSYLGDSTVGQGVNIGAGVITANYDGYKKHITTIHSQAMVGANATLIAPVTIGEGAIVGAGSLIHKSVQEQSLVYNPVELAVKSSNNYHSKKKGT